MLGTFSGGGLGMGVAFFLEDFFSQSADEIEKKMDSLGGKTAELGGKIQRSMDQIKVGTALAVAGAAILAPFVASTKAASDYEENLNKLTATFGTYANEVRRFVDEEALRSTGLSKNQASESITLFGDMATAMKIPQKEAADLSIRLAQLEGDLTSFKNLEDGRAQTALKGIFTGETETLKGLGIVMTQTTLQAFATSQGINKAFKDLSQSEKVALRAAFVMDATKNSLNDFEKTSFNYANANRIARGALENLSITLGQVLLPIMTKLNIIAGNVFEAIDKFGQSKFGKFVLGAVAAMGAFLFITGISLVMLGGLRFGLAKAAEAFGAKTRATILATMAESGFAAGLWATATALWATLAPVLLVIAAIALVTLIGYKAWQMISSGEEQVMKFGIALSLLLGPIGLVITAVAGIRAGFNSLSEWDGETEVGGVLGFFMKVAGVIQAVGEIWQSFNGKTFTLTKELADKLEAMGILGFVVKIGTLVSRARIIFDSWIRGFSKGFAAMKEIFSGTLGSLQESFNSIWNSFGRIFSSLGNILSPLIDLFHTLTGGMFESAGSLDLWKALGWIIENVVVLGFKQLAWTISLVVEAIAGIVQAAVWMISKLIEWGSFIIGFIIQVIDAIVGAVLGIRDAIWSGLGSMFEFGSNLVISIWNGFKSMFPSMAEWISNVINSLITNLIAPIGDKVIAGFKAVKNFLGFGDDEEVPDPEGTTPVAPTGVGGDGPRNIQAGTSKSPTIINNSSANSSTVNNNSNTTNSGGEGAGQPIILQTVLDGQIISEKVIEEMEFKQARQTG